MLLSGGLEPPAEGRVRPIGYARPTEGRDGALARDTSRGPSLSPKTNELGDPCGRVRLRPCAVNLRCSGRLRTAASTRGDGSGGSSSTSARAIRISEGTSLDSAGSRGL